jgi:DNA repair protein RadC
LHIIALNRQLQVLGHQCLFRGTVDACPIHPREIFAYLLTLSASEFIMTHNHPTGSANPSSEDIAMTKRIQKAAGLMGIPLIDHLILSSSGYFSLTDHQLLPKYQSFF